MGLTVNQPTVDRGDAFVQARRQLIMDDRFVYFGVLAMHTTLVADPTVQTAAVNNVRLRYNPAYVESLNPEQRRALMGHELLHLALGHLWRREGRDLEKWNIACDYVVNETLTKSGFKLPSNWYHSPRYYGKTAEQIYSLLAREEEQKQPQPQSGSGQSNSGSKKQPQEKPENEKGSGTPDKSQKPSQAAGKPDPSQPTAGKEGTPNNEKSDGPGEPGDQPGNGESPAMGEPGSGDPGFSLPSGVFTDPEDEGGQEEIPGEAEWKIVAQQAASAAKRAGHLPGGMEETLSKSREAQIDWKSELKDFFTNSIPSNKSWCNPNRRFVGDGLYLPGNVNENIGYIAGGMDTSGSMSQPMLQDVGDEMTDIISELRPEYFDFVCVDQKVQSVTRFEPGDDVVLVAKGRGGTYFKPFFDWIGEQDQEPVCAIYFTDMDNGDILTAADEPGYPVLWCTPDYVTKNPPFGRVLRIPNAH